MFSKFTFILLFAAFALPALADDIPDQPVSLIPADGSLDGWTKHYGKAIPPKSKWTNEAGKLVLDQSRNADGGDIVTAREYTNFVLDFTWVASKSCNSGIKYRLKDFGKDGAKVNYSSDFGWLGCEYQILDTANGEEKNSDGRWATASVYSVFAPDKEKKHLNPAGERNTGRIVVLDNHVEHWLNGEKVLEYEVGSDAWKDAVSKSKFYRDDAKAEGFGENPAGFIMLQDHGNSITFEKVEIREIR